MIPQHYYRHIYLLIGPAHLRLQAFKQLTQYLRSPNVITLNPETYPAQAVLTNSGLSCSAFSQLTQTLGSTCDALLFDMEQGVSASGLAIAAGTIQGGGVFAIGLPTIDEWLLQSDEDMAHYLPWPLESKEQVSYFKHYLITQLLSHSRPTIKHEEPMNKGFHVIDLDQQDALFNLTPVQAIPTKTFTLNNEQNRALDQLSKQIDAYYSGSVRSVKAPPKEHHASFLTAHRGRGKSSLLGILLTQLLNNGYRAAVTAPRKKALHTLESHFYQAQQHTQTRMELPFYAPDELIKKRSQFIHSIDILIIDEAAAIPLALLEALSEIYAFVIFSSTDHGYESGGKGFGLRLAEHLAKQNTKLTYQTLTTPVRWQAGDYLEQWLDSLLFLYADAASVQPLSVQSSSIQAAHTQTAHIQTSSIINAVDPFVKNQMNANKDFINEYNLAKFNGKDWLHNFDALPSLFHLLINAHYQTSPNDIRWVLDDPSTSVFTYAVPSFNAQVETKKRVIQPTCAAIVTEEGPIEATLAQAVLEGRRRPRGHLLPQSLLAHEGHKDAANFTYWRISRIATQINKRRENHASKLLEAIEQDALAVTRQESRTTKNGIDFLCASFAATKESMLFWQKNGFFCVRLGTSKDQASACYSVMMVKPLNDEAKNSSQQWQQAYLANLRINLLRDYQDIEQSLVPLLKKSDTFQDRQKQAENDLADLQLFVHHKRPYLTVRAQLTRFLQQAIASKRLERNHAQFDFLQALMQQPASDMQFQHFGLNSRKAAEAHIKKVVLSLMTNSI